MTRLRRTFSLLSAAAIMGGIALLGIPSAPAASPITHVTVAAPAVGKSKLQLVSLQMHGSSAQPVTFQITNLSALGQGFDAVAFEKTPLTKRGTAGLYLLMFMGNRSSSPAQTVDLTVTPPAGDTIDGYRDLNAATGCHDLEVFNSKFEGGYTLYRVSETLSGDVVNVIYTLKRAVPASFDNSAPEAFVDSVMPTMWGSCPGSPETPDEGNK